jgi:hypothetical protein
MRKVDVKFHSDYYGPSRPAVNVKVYQGLHDGMLAFRKANPDVPKRFTVEWIENNLSSDAIEQWWQWACENGFENAESDAHEIFGDVTVYTEGRSSGWVVVEGLKDFEQWNGADLAKWGKFARACRAYADDVPYQAVDMIYHNRFLSAEEERDQELIKEQVV